MATTTLRTTLRPRTERINLLRAAGGLTNPRGSCRGRPNRPGQPLSRVLAGKQSPSLTTAMSIAGALRTNVEDIFEYVTEVAA